MSFLYKKDYQETELELTVVEQVNIDFNKQQQQRIEQLTAEVKNKQQQIEQLTVELKKQQQNATVHSWRETEKHGIEITSAYT